jgi:hypothetical protein
MGFVVRSVIGLGAVYYAMFAPALNSGDLAKTATVCAGAVETQASRENENTLRAELATAGCAVSFGAEAQRLATSLTLPTVAPPAPPRQARPASGSLTAEDLAEPWYGPDPRTRKLRSRG